ncbi:farnesoate epoxidase-like [Lytechinus pictus]|uniref:farnesoate epoxidase-like n=1 Tax=Lytechinus pictus TaxID=7653 RepID=UPI0030B9DFD5
MALDYISINDASLVSGVLKTSFLALLCYFIYQFFNNGKRYNYPPGPTGLPLLGSVLSLIFTKKYQHEVVAQWTKKYGNFISIKLFNTRLVILSDEQLIQEVFGGHHAVDRPAMPVVKETTGRKFAGMRISSKTRRFACCQRLKRAMGKCSNPNQWLYASIGNIILKIATGVSYEYDDDKLRRILVRSKRIFDALGPGGLINVVPILAAIPSRSKQLLTEGWSGLFDHMRESVASHRSATVSQGDDFIKKYLEMSGKVGEVEGKGSFDETNLLESSLEMLIGGLETSATSLEWILHTLASHPEAQRRIRQEMAEVIGKDRFPQYSDHNRMPQTMAIIAECMRFRPVAPFPLSHVAVEDFKIGEYDIPNGTQITFSVWDLARSPMLWEKPEEFRLDRFLTKDGKFNKKREPSHFGVGRRICPGEVLARAEIFLFTTYIVRRFKLRLAEGTPENPKCLVGLTVRPEPYHIHAEKIE